MQKAQKRKVLFVLPTLGSGGAERVLITVLNNIDTAQFSPEFLAFNESGQAREWISESIPFHSFGRKSVRQSFLPLIKFIRTHKPDILFTTMVHTNALACVMKILFPKMKVIIRESSIPSALLTEYGNKGKICKFIYRFLYPRADLVISPAQMIVDEFNHYLKIGGIKHKVIYNPVDTARIYPAIPQNFDDAQGDIVRFVAIGRLAREKGLDRLITALAVADFDFKWRLDLIGDGDQRSKLEELIAQKNLQEHIKVCGYDAQPWNKGARGDCLLLPSLWEGMPNVALEALACGLPVIALKSAGAIGEVAAAAQNGDVYIAASMGDLIAAMKDVKPQGKRAKAPSKLPDIFTLEHIVQEYQKSFMSVL